MESHARITKSTIVHQLRHYRTMAQYDQAVALGQMWLSEQESKDGGTLAPSPDPTEMCLVMEESYIASWHLSNRATVIYPMALRLMQHICTHPSCVSTETLKRIRFNLQFLVDYGTSITNNDEQQETHSITKKDITGHHTEDDSSPVSNMPPSPDDGDVHLSEWKARFLQLWPLFCKCMEREDLEQVFTGIYDKCVWGHGDSMTAPKSGDGSSIREMRDFVPVMSNLLKRYEVSSFVDLACGDLTWIPMVPEFTTKQISYHGIDIVPSLIESHQKQHASWATFQQGDLRSATIPEADMYFTKEALQHLNDDEILDALRNIAKHKFRYCVISTHIMDQGNDVHYFRGVYRWRRLDFRLPPYNLLAYRELIIYNRFAFLICTRDQLIHNLQHESKWRVKLGRQIVAKWKDIALPLSSSSLPQISLASVGNSGKMEQDCKDDLYQMHVQHHALVMRTSVKIPRILHLFQTDPREVNEGQLHELANEWRKVLPSHWRVYPWTVPFYMLYGDKGPMDGLWTILYHQGGVYMDVGKMVQSSTPPSEHMANVLDRCAWASAVVYNGNGAIDTDKNGVREQWFAVQPEHPWMALTYDSAKSRHLSLFMETIRMDYALMQAANRTQWDIAWIEE